MCELEKDEFYIFRSIAEETAETYSYSQLVYCLSTRSRRVRVVAAVREGAGKDEKEPQPARAN